MLSSSLWLDTAGERIVARPALPGDTEVDVAIVGAGLTGCWTAYYLTAAAPGLKVTVLEAEVAGFGASGRNGGWCSALFAASPRLLARTAGRESAIAMRLAMQATVDEVGRVTATEGIDCDFEKGGTVELARTPAQLVRARHEVAEAASFGCGEEDLRLLGREEALALCNASSVLGGTYTPHCATVHPLRLVRGLAARLEARGVLVYEGTRVREVRPRGDGRSLPEAVSDLGTVRAEAVILATEAYGAHLRGYERSVVPLYSLMVATEPLSSDLLGSIGLTGRQSFTDLRNLVIYGQRTADGRIAFGGRGAPYHYNSSIRPSYDTNESIHAALRADLLELFPALFGVEFTHAWGGPLGLPRDWFPSVDFDRATGIGRAGGYVGDGVATTNLAGRILAELVLDQPRILAGLPFARHRSPAWEPEPLRYLGINAMLVAAKLADAEERRSGRPSLLARATERLLGG